jgi:hypothetical protein
MCAPRFLLSTVNCGLSTELIPATPIKSIGAGDPAPAGLRPKGRPQPVRGRTSAWTGASAEAEGVRARDSKSKGRD